jgi:hypothetical protein
MRESTHEAMQGTDRDARGAGQFFGHLWAGCQEIGDATLSHNAQGHGNARTDEQFGKALIRLRTGVGHWAAPFLNEGLIPGI